MFVNYKFTLNIKNLTIGEDDEAWRGTVAPDWQVIFQGWFLYENVGAAMLHLTH